MAAASDVSEMASRLAGARVFPTSEEDDAVLEAAHNTILRWDLSNSESARRIYLWDRQPEEVTAYLEAVDQIRGFVARPNGDKRALDRAQTTLQIAMLRLEEEMCQILKVNSESVDPDWLFDPVSGPAQNAFSWSFGDVGAEPCSNEAAAGTLNTEEETDACPLKDFCFTIPLLPPDVVLDLAGIAVRMVEAGYDTECCQTYVDIRKAVLEQSLSRLGLERITIQESQQMPWDELEAEMAKWVRMMRPVVRVIMRSEKHLCDQVFAGSAAVLAGGCFSEIARAAMTQLLNFGEAAAIGRRAAEKLFKLLDMYERLRQLLPDIEAVFAACEGVCAEAVSVVALLAEAARGTFAAFKAAVQHWASTTPVPGGAVHPLTRYVMNYLRLVSVYTDTLNKLLVTEETAIADNTTTGGGDTSSESVTITPLSVQVTTLMNYLETNLEEASKLYRDPALPFIFLMNNVHYIVQKVRDSEVRTLLGDDWIRWRNRKVRQCHSSYQRIAWNKVVLCLRDEGLRTSGSFSSGVSKSVLRERFKNFNAAFEENLRTQSSWVVSDFQLSTELRISVGDLLLPAYRSFYGRFQSYFESERHPEKYIKYTPEEIEACLNDLFTGTAGSSNSVGSTRRRSSLTSQ